MLRLLDTVCSVPILFLQGVLDQKNRKIGNSNVKKLEKNKNLTQKIGGK